MSIGNLRRYSGLFALATLAACQRAAVAPSSASAHTVPGAPVASPARAADANSANLPADVGVDDPSPFVETVRLPYAARLDVAGARTFLTTERLLLAVSGDAVRVDLALLEGLQPGRAQFPRVFGNMPESGWAVQTSYAERTSRSSLSRWTGSEWVDANHLLRDRNVLGISPWSNGRTLALVASDYEKTLQFVQLGGKRGAPPQLPQTARDTYGCVHGLQPAAMSALASGEVYLAGTRCSVGADEEVTVRGVVINSWAPGQARAKVEVLPGLSEKEAAGGEINSIVATSRNDVFVAGGRVPNTPEDQEAQVAAYLAHFDGKDWRSFSAPPVERIDDLQRTPDGHLWALANGALWSTVGGASESATWRRVPLPQSASELGQDSVSSFWVQDNEQVWATLGSEDLTYLVRTKRGSEPLSLPSEAQIAQLSSALDPMAAYQCDTPTLMLLTLARSAPKDADMPSIRRALLGHSELEGKVQFIELPFLTRRYLGARGDMDSLLATQAILSSAYIPGVAPEMRCLDGAPTRTLSVDFGGAKPELPAAHQQPSPRRRNL